MSTPVRGLRQNCIMREAVELIGHHRCSGLPVVDESGGVLGVVSDYDCLKMIGSPDLLDDNVELHMSRNPITVDVETRISKVAYILVRSEIRRVPVTENGTLVGIISRSDLVTFAREHLL